MQSCLVRREENSRKAADTKASFRVIKKVGTFLYGCGSGVKVNEWS